MPPLPDRLELVPTTGWDGKCTQWEGGGVFSLSAPILDVSVQELLDDEFHRLVRKVLHFWVDIDLANLARIRAGIQSFQMPDEYHTNATEFCGWVTQGITRAPDLGAAMKHVKECVAYLSVQLSRRGDVAGAARCALLLRHFFKDDGNGGTHGPFLHAAINAIVGGEENYLFRGVDSLNALLDERLVQAPIREVEGHAAG